jgi:hypothetical protein
MITVLFLFCFIEAASYLLLPLRGALETYGRFA